MRFDTGNAPKIPDDTAKQEDGFGLVGHLAQPMTPSAFWSMDQAIARNRANQIYRRQKEIRTVAVSTRKRRFFAGSCSASRHRRHGNGRTEASRIVGGGVGRLNGGRRRAF